MSDHFFGVAGTRSRMTRAKEKVVREGLAAITGSAEVCGTGVGVATGLVAQADAPRGARGGLSAAGALAARGG